MTSQSFVFENVLDEQNDKNLIDFECDLQASPAEDVKMVHKTLKRKREKSDKSLEASKKQNVMISPKCQPALNNTIAFANELIGNPSDETLSEMSFMNQRDVAAFNSTIRGVDDEDISLKPDQDHDYILKEESQLLHAKVMSLELDLVKNLLHLMTRGRGLLNVRRGVGNMGNVWKNSRLIQIQIKVEVGAGSGGGKL